MTRLRQEPLTLAAICAVFALLVLFVAYPLGWVAKASLTAEGGGFTLAHFAQLFLRRHFLAPILNSLLLATVVATLGTAVGFLFAFAVTRTALPGRRALRKLVNVPLISPPFVISLSAILLLGRNGLVTTAALERLGVDLYARGFDIYGLGGLALVETLSYFPTAFLLLVGVLAGLDGSLEEAAQSLGASRARTFWRVTLPLCAPALLSAFLLLFIESLADFGNPLILGGRFHVLSVQAYLQIVGNDDAAGGSALALVLLLPSLALYVLQTALLRRRSFVTVTGKAARLQARSVSRGAQAALGVACALGAGVIAVFYGLVVYGSLVKLWGMDPTLSLATYAKVLRSSRQDLFDTVLLGALSAPLTAAFALLAGYLIERKRFPGRRVMEVLCLLTFAVPGTVVGIGYALAFSRPPLALTGTATLLVMLLAFRNAPVGLKAATSGLKQLDVSLEEAAANLGASPPRVLASVTLPLLAPAVLGALVFSFVRAVTAVSAVIFVVSASWNLLTVSILGYVEASDLSHAAAQAVVLVAMVLLVFEGISALLRRAFPHRLAEL